MLPSFFFSFAAVLMIANCPTTSGFPLSVRSTSIRALCASSQDDTEGEALAKDFFKEIEKREGNSQADEIVGEVAPRKFTGSDLGTRSATKFTGRDSLFSQNGSSNTNKTPLDREREREFRLAGNFEQTLPLQAALVVFSLVVVLTVGLTGGITDGSDRFFDDDIDYMGGNYLEEIRSDTLNSNPSEGVDVVQKSSDSGVWL